MPQEISGDAARALGLPVQEEVAGDAARALGLPLTPPQAPTPTEPPPSFMQGVPPIKSSINLVDPTEKSDLNSALEQHIDAAGIGAFSSPANDARRALRVARDMGAHPDLLQGANDVVDKFEQQSNRDRMSWKLAQLPRLAEWMAQGTQYAAAIQSEVDKWGALDYVFGKKVKSAAAQPDPVDINRWYSDNEYQETWKRKNAEENDAPGWVLAFGRAAYSTSTSVQSWAQSLYGPTKDTGKNLQTIQQQRDVADQPIPGDSDPVLKRVNSVIGMAPLLAASAIHPAVAFGLMYTETSGRTYEDMRLNGYDHESATDISNMIGFSTATIGSLMGPMFKFNFLPKETLGLLGSVPNSMLQSMLKNPTMWRTAVGFGKNLIATMAMNTAMATSEVATKEAFDSAKENRPYDLSRVTSAGKQAADSWVEMAALSVLPAYREHAERVAAHGAAQEINQADMHWQLISNIYDNYEERGRALRSMHDAAQLATVVTSLKDSEFMKTNPEDARDLIRHLTAGHSTAYISSDALAKLSPDDLALLGNPDASMPGKVPIELSDLLMHPKASDLVKDTAGEPDLLSIKELTGLDLSKPPNVMGTDVKDEDLDKYLADEAQRRKDQQARGARIPTPEEIRSAVQGAKAAEEPPGTPPSGESPKAESQEQSNEPPTNPREMKAWAESAVVNSKISIDQLKTIGKVFTAQGAKARQAAYKSQVEATEHATAQRTAAATAATNAASESQRSAVTSEALSAAVKKALDEASKARARVQSLSTDGARAKAWSAGMQYGEAHDALMEALGFADRRGYSAPDLTDIYAKLSNEQKLTGVAFEGFNLDQVNQVVRDRTPFNELRFSDVREVRKALDSITKAVEAENSIYSEGERASKGLFISDVMEHLKKIPDKPPGQDSSIQSKEALSARQRFGVKVAELAASFNSPHTLFFKLGKGGDYLWFDRFVPAVAREERIWSDVNADLERVNKGMRTANGGFIKPLEGASLVFRRPDGVELHFDAGNTLNRKNPYASGDTVSAMFEGKSIGGLSISRNDDSGHEWSNPDENRGKGSLYPQSVGVDKAFQRRGIASDMYSLVEKVLGEKITDSKVQTDEGAALREGMRKSPKELKGEFVSRDTAVPPEQMRAIGDIGSDRVPGLKGGLAVRSDVWRLVLHLGVEGADSKIARGMGIDPAQLHEWAQSNIGRTPEEARQVMSTLIEPHWKIYNKIWNEYEQHFKERGIAPPEKLQPQKYTVAGQEYSGGYGGKLKWIDFKNNPVNDPSALESLFSHDTNSPATDNSHLNERTNSGAGTIELSWSTNSQSMRKEIHDIAMRPFVEDALKIFGDSEVRAELSDKIGKQALNQIYDPSGDTSFLHTVARGSVADIHTATAFTQTVMQLQGLAAYNAFSLNFRVMGGQLSHLAAAKFGLGIPAIDMISGTQAAFSPERRSWAMAASSVLRLRAEDYQRRGIELNEQMTGVKGVGQDMIANAVGPTLNAPRAAADHLNWMAWREMDLFLSHAIWESAYSKAVGSNRSVDIAMGKFSPATHEEAVRAADKAITMMMPSQDVYDKAAFVRDRSVAGFFYLVRNFPATLGNVGMMNWWEAKTTGQTLPKSMAIAKNVGMVMAAEMLGKGLIMQGGPSDKDEPEQWAAEHAASSLFYPFMLSDVALAAVHAAQGDAHKALHDIGHLTPAAINVIANGMMDIASMQSKDPDGAYRAGTHLMSLILKTPIPTKAFDLTQAAHAEDPADAAKKAMGYRQ